MVYESHEDVIQQCFNCFILRQFTLWESSPVIFVLFFWLRLVIIKRFEYLLMDTANW